MPETVGWAARAVPRIIHRAGRIVVHMPHPVDNSATPEPDGPRSDATAAPAPDTAALRDRFAAALSAAGAPDTDPYPYADALLARWAEPQRRYHTVRHLASVLDRVDTLEDYAADPALVRLAAWFHDAVYRPDRSENEERSAGLAQRALSEAGLGAGGIAEVARLVRLTTSHAPEPEDANGAVLCDADLAILASNPSAYAAYAAEVREEYGFVPDDAFRAGRSDVLRQLLALPSLFTTPHGVKEWEAAARRNLAAELRLLAAG
jgi:predicted metal-dependent HD superfamily phosphohydrolase